MTSFDRAAATVGAGFLARAAATGATTVGGIAVTVLAVRGLGSERYGAVAFGLAISTLAAVAARVGLGGAVTREVASATASTDAPEAVAMVVGAAWRVVVPTALVAGVAAGLASAFAPLETQFGGRAILGLGLATLVVGVNVAATATFVARGVGQMTSAEVPQVVIVITQVLGFGWLAVGADAPSVGVTGAGIVLLASGGAGAFAGVATINRAVPGLSLAAGEGGARRLIRRAAPFALAGVATQMIAQADVIVLGIARGADQVGSYDPMLRITDRGLLLGPALFLAGFVPAATAQLARGEHDAFGRLYARTGTLAYVLSVAPLTLLAAFPHEVVGALFPQVRVDITVLAVLTAGYAVHLIFGLNTGALIATGDRRGIVAAYGLAFAAALIFVAILVPWLGQAGAAYSTAGSYVVMNVAITRTVYRATGSHPFDRRHVVAVVTSVIPLGGGIGIATALGPTSLPVAIAVAVAIWGVWLAGLGVAGTISREDLRAFSRRVE